MSNEKPPDAIPEHETVESARSVDQDQTLRAGGDQLTSLATMRHALRTPLNHIIGYSEMLLEEAGERHLDDFAADIQKIRTAGRQLLTLINDLLEPMSTQAASPALAPKTTGSSALLGDPEPGSRPSAEDRGPAPETLSSRLLVVDDNASNRDMLSSRLKQQGYDVSTAESGRQALEWVATQPVDLVLLDVMMP
ncbi:MAG: response regulator, partial [Planctomycetota bacterium]